MTHWQDRVIALAVAKREVTQEHKPTTYDEYDGPTQVAKCKDCGLGLWWDGWVWMDENQGDTCEVTK